MRLRIAQHAARGELTIHMAENCHGDSAPPIDTIHFSGVRERIAHDTAELAAAIVAARWTGELLDFGSTPIGVDAAEAARLIAPEALYLTPLDGYRRNLCEGDVDVLVAPTALAAEVLGAKRSERVLTRLVTWSGEFVTRATRSSRDYMAGEVSTNADLLLSAWEVSVVLGLLFGGQRLRSIIVPGLEPKDVRDFERIARALRIVGVRLISSGNEPSTIAPQKRSTRRQFQPALGRAEPERA